MLIINGVYDMELQQLRLFLAAAEAESFTRGAERAFVSQPALSTSISKLEAEMGVKLFTRNKRNVVLTPAGRTLVKRARVIVGECSRAKDELKRHNIQSLLRLGVVNTLPITLVARLIEQYRRDNPGITISVIDASNTDLEQLAQEDRIDMALTLLQDKTSGQRRFIHARELFRESYRLAVTADHHLSQSPVVSFDDLENEPFVIRSHCEHRKIIQGILKSREIRLNIAYVTNQDDRAMALVRSGIGVAIVPECYQAPDIMTCAIQEVSAQRVIGFEWGEGENRDQVSPFIEFAATARWGQSRL